jgi:hypothetical protein
MRRLNSALFRLPPELGSFFCIAISMEPEKVAWLQQCFVDKHSAE